MICTNGDRVLRTKQGAVSGCVAEPRPADEAGEAEQGQRSVFCKPAATGAAKAGHRNPEPRSGFCKRAPTRAAKIG